MEVLLSVSQCWINNLVGLIDTMTRMMRQKSILKMRKQLNFTFDSVFLGNRK